MDSRRSTNRARLLAAAAVVTALGLGASACGGSGSSSDTTTTTGATATAAWASAVCTSFSAWKASLQRAKTSLAGNPSTEAFQNASHQVSVATQGLASSLQQLGKPPTSNSATVQQSITTLKTQLQSGRDKINATLNGSNNPTPAQRRANVATVRTTANSMLNSFTSTVNDLKSLDPGSDLEKAFQQTTACDPFFT